MRYFLYIVGCAFFFALSGVSIVHAQSTNLGASFLTPDGIFSCRTGKYAMDVGTMSAIGGLYVPVNDAAVTLNTGYLIYKECSLDPLTKKIGEGITAGIVATGIKGAQTGNDGKPVFLTNYGEDLTLPVNKTVLAALQGPDAESICSTVKRRVVATVVRQHLEKQQPREKRLACTLQCSESDMRAMIEKSDPEAIQRCGGIQAYYELFLSPANTDMGAYIQLNRFKNEQAALREAQERFYVQTGNGFRPAEQIVDNVRRITTPGSVIAGTLQQLVGSGFRQLENANEIDQIIGALFSSLSTQLITDSRGLTGLTQSPSSGQPSYLDQLVSQSSATVRQYAVNTALGILSTWRASEANILSAKNATASKLNEAIAQLRGAEKKCWDDPSIGIVDKVKAYAAAQGGGTLKIATSTAFSTAVIEASIEPVATSAIEQIRTSEQALRIIDQLIADVTNSGAQSVQAVAIQKLESLVKSGAIQDPTRLPSRLKAEQDLQTAIADEVTEALKRWAGGEGGSTSWDKTVSPGTGWCNTNNQETIRLWYEVWTR